jgi:hypothetical protein
MTQGRTDGSPPNQRRVTVREAVAALGISEGAVRMRIKRGTLESTREHARGRAVVRLTTHRPHARPYAI